MASAPDATFAAIVGGVASLITLAVSKWLDSGAASRRAQHDERRADDRERTRELSECHALVDELRAKCSEVYADNAALRAVLLGRNIPFPPTTPDDPRSP